MARGRSSRSSRSSRAAAQTGSARPLSASRTSRATTRARRRSRKTGAVAPLVELAAHGGRAEAECGASAYAAGALHHIAAGSAPREKAIVAANRGLPLASLPAHRPASGLPGKAHSYDSSSFGDHHHAHHNHRDHGHGANHHRNGDLRQASTASTTTTTTSGSVATSSGSAGSGLGYFGCRPSSGASANSHSPASDATACDAVSPSFWFGALFRNARLCAPPSAGAS